MVYPSEKIRPPFLGAYEFFLCPSNPLPPLLLLRCILSPRDSPMATMPSVVTITSKGRDSVVKPTGYFCTFSHVTIA